MPKAKCLCDECKVRKCDKKKNLVRRKQGKRNRNTGRYAEKLFQKWCDEHNLKATATVMSGKHKELANTVGTKKYLFSGDFHIENLTKERLKVEVKKRQFDLVRKYYAATKFGDVVHIKGFCYVLSADNLIAITQGRTNFNEVQIEDTKHALLHSFFEQDNADIVAIISQGENNRYLDFVFAIQENVYKKMMKQKEN